MVDRPNPVASRLPLKSGIPAPKTTSTLGMARNMSKSVPDLAKTATDKKPLANSKAVSTTNLVKKIPKENCAIKRTATAITGPEKSHGGKRPLLQTNQGSRQGAVRKANQPTQPTKLQDNVKPKAWDLRGQVSLYKDKVAHLNKELEALRLLNAESVSLSAEKEMISQSLKEKEDELNLVKESLESKTETCHKQEQTLTQLTIKAEELAQSKDILQMQFQTVLLEKEKLVEELERTQQILKDLERKLEKSSLENESLKSALQDALEKNSQLLDDKFQANCLRKVMHNQIMDLKGNIRVYIRVRPVLNHEENKEKYLIGFPSLECMEIQPQTAEVNAATYGTNRKTEKKSFTLNRVFPPHVSQEDVFCDVAELVQSVLDGFNVCVCAYGITGSGKTFTMEGESNTLSRGVIPRAIESIFIGIENLKALGWNFTVAVSCFEVYNEEIKDLIDYNNKNSLEIRKSNKAYEELCISNLTVKEVKCAESVNDVLSIAQRNRSVAATTRNKYSSRSHSITKVDVTGENHQRKLFSYGSLYLVDLAGSEKMDDDNNEQRKKETTKINQSLTQLRTVIFQLAAGVKVDNIDYRTSKLTHILKPCLGGNSKTLVLVTLSPLQEHYLETVSSLRFAVSLSSCKQKASRQVKAKPK